MSISKYYKGRDKLFSDQKAEREIMLAHGISAEKISELHEEDYKRWKANRVFEKHNNISTENLSEETLAIAWAQQNNQTNPYDCSGDFLDSIGDKNLLAILRELPPEDLIMVQRCWSDGVTHSEYAASIGKSRSAITRKLLRIQKKTIANIKNKKISQ